MIFCGNRDQVEVEKTLVESLFSFTSNELLVSTPIPSSLLFISEVLAEREPRIDWLELLRREMRDRGL